MSSTSEEGDTHEEFEEFYVESRQGFSTFPARNYSGIEETTTTINNGSTSSEKGKGKEKEAVVGGRDADKMRAESDKDKRIRELQDELNLLKGVNLDTLNGLIEEDPTNVSDLDITTKLMKSLHLLSSLLPSSQGYSPDTTISNIAHVDIMELLSSALADIVYGSCSNTPPIPSPSYDLHQARAMLEMKIQAAGGSSIALDEIITNTSRTSGNISSPRTTSTSTNRPNCDEIASLYAENTRLLILALRPAFLDVFHINPETISNEVQASPCYINRLPAEILSIIFGMARKECEVKVASLNNPEYDEYTGTLMRPVGTRNANNSFMGSSRAAQRWIHSLALVSQYFKSTSINVAYYQIDIRKRLQLIKLLNVLNSPSTSDYCDYILEIDAKVAIPPDSTIMQGGSRIRVGGGGGGVGGNGIGVFNTSVLATSWNGGDDATSPNSDAGTDGSSEVKEGVETKESHSELFGRIVLKARNLNKLSLIMQTSNYPMGRNSTTDFLDPAILNVLSSLPSSLRTLRLGSSIDFEELEVVLLASPFIIRLRLEGGLDSLDGQGVVSANTPHKCQFTEVVIGDGNPRDFTAVTDVQLAWLLEPAVLSLEHIEISIMSLGANGMGLAGGWGVIVAPAAPPFASSLFADLISRMGKTLKLLSFRDAQNGNAVSPSLNNPPHNGSFDYALRSARQLQELTIQLHLTGPQFLNSLSSSLISLILLGVSRNFSATDLASMIENGTFSQLKRLIISGSFNGRGIGWSGKEFRALKAIAARKGIKFSSQ